ncbi:twin-arginine translocase subunit TatC [Selenomonadales bacterium OttesenSCG-928-I06]|nr:twin-arginine translocase subunit TatC [Selenomonadales bacterium OttesenSCG-928-I06]
MSDSEIKKENNENTTEEENQSENFSKLYDDDDDYNYELELDKVKGNMSIINHLDELRKRIIIIAAVFIVTTCCSFYFSEQIVNFITISAGKLHYTLIGEAFFVRMKVSVVAGIIISLPVIIYQIWLFISPGLRDSEKKAGIYLVPSAVFLFYLGTAFSYFLVLPSIIDFLQSFQTENLQEILTLDKYTTFVFSFVLPFGFVFQLPVVIIILTKFGIINPYKLQKYRKYFILIAFIVGAVISPTPDILSQCMIAIPTILLFEIGLILAKITAKSKKDEEPEETEDI